MIGSEDRLIYSNKQSDPNEIRHLLAGILVGELLSPSDTLWLVSPWIRNVDILDNRSGAFRGIGSAWGKRQVKLFEILGELTHRGTKVRLVTLENEGNQAALKALTETGFDERLKVIKRDDLHTKGLLGDDYFVHGSMNFTYRGIHISEELLRLVLSSHQIAEAKLNFSSEYGGDT